MGENWKTEFNIAKCNVLKNQRRLEPFIFNCTRHNFTAASLRQQILPSILWYIFQKILSGTIICNKNTNKANKTIGFLMRNLKYCSTEPRGLQLNTSYQYGTVIEARTLCRLKWFRGEELVGSCHVTIVRTMCLICLVALDWNTLQSH